MPDYNEKPNTIPGPPIITIGSILAAWLVHIFVPIDWLYSIHGLIWPLGVVMIIAALSIDVWAFKTFDAASTTIMPNKAVKNLVTHGPFAWSRNPIYVGNVVLIVGIALVSANSWMLLAAAEAAVLIEKLAILREEAHIKANFEQEWSAYSAKVRRWI